MLHSHLPYVLNHGRWPHGSDWLCEAAVETYLPLLEALRDLEAANIAAPVTIGFTPVLANQLDHPSFEAELEHWIDARFADGREAMRSMRGTPDEPLIPLVRYWQARLRRLYELLHEVGGDITGQVRAMQDRERLEVTSSAATHAFLPLLGRDESLRLQLNVGRVEHHRIFGRDPEGCWLPECGYRPAGEWAPMANAYNAGWRAGLETHLADAGYRYTFVDAHMVGGGAPVGEYGWFDDPSVQSSFGQTRVSEHALGSPYRSFRIADSPVAAFARDTRASSRVWDRHGGYPGDAAYLEFHKQRWPGGLRLWCVTSREGDLGDKLPYSPVEARRMARRHALDFAGHIATTRDGSGDPARVVTVPFDTELFGHWWFEGPEFLRHWYAALPRQRGLRAVTAGEHLDSHGPGASSGIAEGSWGRNGDFGMWMNDQVAWMWPVIWELENRFWDVARDALAQVNLAPILDQAARELLLLQSSDWPFIMTTGAVDDYAARRFNQHAYDCRELVAWLVRGLRGENVERGVQRAHELQQRDDLFRAIRSSIVRALEPSA